MHKTPDINDDPLLEELRRKHAALHQPDDVFRKMFQEGVLERFYQSFEVYLTGEYGSWLEGVQAVADALLVNEGNKSRWKQRQQRISWDNILLFLTKTRVNLQRVRFPGFEFASFGGYARLLTYVRHCLDASAPVEPLDEHTLSKLVLLFEDPRWRNVESVPELQRALPAVAQRLNRQLSTQQRISPDEIRRLLAIWTVPWVIFERILDDWVPLEV